MRIEIYPPHLRSDRPDEPEPVRLRRRVLEAIHDEDLPLACEIVAAAEAEHAGTTDPHMVRALEAIRRYVTEGKDATLKRLKSSTRLGFRARRNPVSRCTRCQRGLPKDATGTVCGPCRNGMGSASIRTVSGGLPTLGKRRR